MSRTAQYQIQDGDGQTAVLRLSGDWSSTGIGRQGERLRADLAGRAVDTLDLTQLGRFDTAGALAIAQATTRMIPEAAWAERPEAGRIYAMVEKLDRETCAPPRRTSRSRS